MQVHMGPYGFIWVPGPWALAAAPQHLNTTSAPHQLQGMGPGPWTHMYP